MSHRKKKQLILIIIFTITSILVWKYKRHLAPKNIISFVKDSVQSIGIGKGFPCDIYGTTINKNNFQTIGKDLIFVSDTSIIALNNSAKEITNRQHSFASPILKIDGTKALIFNLFGKGFRVESRSEVFQNSTCDENIITAAISDSGTYAIITETKGYYAAMTVYACEQKRQRYKYYFADCCIHDVVLTDDGEKVIAVGHTIVDGAMTAKIYIFDYYHEQPIGCFEYKDTTIISLHTLSSGKVIAIGDNLSSVININRISKEDYSYQDKSLRTYACDKNHGVALVLSSSNGGEHCDVTTLNQNGKFLYSVETDKQVSDISYLNGTIVLLSNNKIIYYKNKGTFKHEKDVDTDTKKILLFKKDSAYLLGISSIKKINIH